MPPTDSIKTNHGLEPSPSTTQPSQLFPSQSQHRHHTSLAQPKVPLPQQHLIAQSQQQQQASQEKANERGEPLAHDPGPKDFRLVTEAGKKAQMAVLMRDMADVGL